MVKNIFFKVAFLVLIEFSRTEGLTFVLEVRVMSSLFLGYTHTGGWSWEAG